MKKTKIYKSSSLVDFHMHSNTSIDGTKTINELFDKAKRDNTAIFSVTDHNTVSGVNSFLDEQNIDRYSVLPCFNNTHFLTGLRSLQK